MHTSAFLWGSSNLVGTLNRPHHKSEDSPPLAKILDVNGYQRVIVGVFDGMGGRGPHIVAGTPNSSAWFASRLALTAVESYVQSSERIADKDSLVKTLSEYFNINNLPELNTKLKIKPHDMYPTTLVLVDFFVSESNIRGSIYWAGDSKAYFYDATNNKLQSLTTNHAYSPDLYSSPLTQWISVSSQDVEEILWRPSENINDMCGILFLCTDGFYNLATDDDIKNLLMSTMQQENIELNQKLDDFIKSHNQNDDISVSWVVFKNSSKFIFHDDEKIILQQEKKHNFEEFNPNYLLKTCIEESKNTQDIPVYKELTWDSPWKSQPLQEMIEKVKENIETLTDLYLKISSLQLNSNIDATKLDAHLEKMFSFMEYQINDLMNKSSTKLLKAIYNQNVSNLTDLKSKDVVHKRRILDQMLQNFKEYLKLHQSLKVLLDIFNNQDNNLYEFISHIEPIIKQLVTEEEYDLIVLLSVNLYTNLHLKIAKATMISKTLLYTLIEFLIRKYHLITLIEKVNQ